MITLAIKQALGRNKRFDLRVDAKHLAASYNDLEGLVLALPRLMQVIDDKLFSGALHLFFAKRQIVFSIHIASSGPAAMTSYDETQGMRITFNENAWVSSFPAMVGGMLCRSADKCIMATFLHEIVHVALFCVYIELGLSQNDIESSIPTQHDTTHNVIFTTWLKRWFNQDTIDNSLLLHVDEGSLVFERTVKQVEEQCLATEHLHLLYKGKWREVRMTQNQEDVPPHHSRVKVIASEQQLIVPNGLLRC